MDEDGPPSCLGPVHRERWTYAAAKQLLERVIWAYGQHHGLKFTVVRPFNVIGPRMDFIPGVDGEGIPRVLAAFMHALLAGRIWCWSTAVASADPSSTSTSSSTRSCASSTGPNLPGPDPEPRQRQERRQHPHPGAEVVAAFRAQRPNARVPRLRTQSRCEFYGRRLRRLVVRIPSMAKATPARLATAHARLAEMLPPIVADYLARYESRVTGDRRPRRLGMPGLP
jgi:UDP-apiose/xylose synthase